MDEAEKKAINLAFRIMDGSGDDKLGPEEVAKGIAKITQEPEISLEEAERIITQVVKFKNDKITEDDKMI